MQFWCHMASHGQVIQWFRMGFIITMIFGSLWMGWPSTIFGEYWPQLIWCHILNMMQNNEPRDQNWECPVSRKWSESINCCVHVEVAVEVQCLWLINWGTEELQPTHVGSSCESCDLRMNCMPICRYAAMSLCRYAIDCSLRCLQSQLHAFLPLWWPYQLLETEIKISQMLLGTWSTMEQCESICGVLCSIKLKHLLQLVFLCLLCFFGCKFCSWGLLRTMQWLWVVLLSASSFSPSWGTEKSCSGETSDLPKKTQPFLDLV